MLAESALRALILRAAGNRRLREFAIGHGMRFGASKFVAGTTLDDLVARARTENARGRRVAAGYLGEGTRDTASAAHVAADFVTIVDRIAAEGLDATLAVKLTHLGLDMGREVAEQHLATIVERAAQHGNFVRIDMEEARYVDVTLEIYRHLRARGLANVGIVLQSYLKRSLDDLASLLPLQPNVRIVKGAYLEDASAAYGDTETISTKFLELAITAFTNRCFVAVATHDNRLIDAFASVATAERSAQAQQFEFQMLLGVRPALQDQLVRAAQPLRISVPFGSDWYPYLMRRMAERPANLILILRNLGA